MRQTPTFMPSNGFLDRWREASRESNWVVIMTFMMPALVFFLFFTAYPILVTFYNSLHIIRPNAQNEFIGLANYHDILTEDRIFKKALVNTLIWATVAPVVDVIIGLILATALYSAIPFGRFFRFAWFTPVLISYVVVGVIWMWIYNYDWGVVNTLLRAVGLESWTEVWLGSPRTALWALIAVDAWKWVGFHMVVCLAALHSLPREVIEAAELDNCGWWAKLIYVKVPMVKGTLINLLILAFIGKMKIFDLVWIMTKGGPLWSTETLGTYTYKRAFQWDTFDLGYPSAIAALSFVLVMIVVLITTLINRNKDKLEY